ncbi:MAG TPA: hypothetical protein DEB60_09775 [Brevundimonas sp.]|nr:hypothetical protein [Brevundimonas sp.]
MAQVTMSEEFAGVVKRQGHEVIAIGPITHPAPEALRVAVEKIRDQYKDQIRFCDIEPLPYFREFVRRLDVALQAEQKGGAA